MAWNFNNGIIFRIFISLFCQINKNNFQRNYYDINTAIHGLLDYDLDRYLDLFSFLRDLLPDLLRDFLLLFPDLDLDLRDLLGGLGLLVLLLLLLTSLSSSLLESDSESESSRLPRPRDLPPILLVVACLLESSLALLTRNKPFY